MSHPEASRKGGPGVSLETVLHFMTLKLKHTSHVHISLAGGAQNVAPAFAPRTDVMEQPCKSFFTDCGR
eukprot:5099509-Pyramimonas_sp.AAC.1